MRASSAFTNKEHTEAWKKQGRCAHQVLLIEMQIVSFWNNRGGPGITEGGQGNKICTVNKIRKEIIRMVKFTTTIVEDINHHKCEVEKMLEDKGVSYASIARSAQVFYRCLS